MTDEIFPCRKTERCSVYAAFGRLINQAAPQHSFSYFIFWGCTHTVIASFLLALAALQAVITPPHADNIKDRFPSAGFAFCLYMASCIIKNENRVALAVGTLHHVVLLPRDGLLSVKKLRLHLHGGLAYLDLSSHTDFHLNYVNFMGCPIDILRKILYTCRRKYVTSLL